MDESAFPKSGNMSLKYSCLALILVMTAAWIYDLGARDGVVALPPGTSPFEQEFTLLAVKNLNAIRAKIEGTFPTDLERLLVTELAGTHNLIAIGKEET